ncbi:MAG: GNAT family N-acetyltransferase [Peptococcaceae bacterium]|nr:GNAT family N-acetyltransferase [Peptococcaceae bacterium]
MALSWRVFLEFEAPGYSPEGIAEFKSYIDPATILAKRENKELDLWGAFDNGAHGSTIVGLLAVRQPLHIALLFVDKKHHGRGIARALLETVLADDLVVGGQHTLTVNSSPYAVPIYQRLGFAPTDREKTVNGLCFVPMKRQVVSC